MQVRSHFTVLVVGTWLVLLTALAGCGGGDTGNRVSGKISFKGTPVPAGKIYINPDGTKGNNGPSGFADITNGTYDTSAPGGKGAVAGAVTFVIEGLDPTPPPGAGPDVTTTILFSNYQVPFELTAGDNVKDIDVPAEAAQPAATSSEGAGQVIP